MSNLNNVDIQRNLNFTELSEFDKMNFHTDDILMMLNVHHFGTITSFNPATQTASATVDYSKVSYIYNTSNGQNLYMAVPSAYPPIVDAPVRFAFSLTNGGFTYVPATGDRCEIVFNDRDMDRWSLGSPPSQPNQVPACPATARLHHFADAVIIVGINPPAVPIPNFDTSRPMMRNGAGTAYVAVNPSNGKTQVKSPTQNLATILQSILTHLQSLSSACAAITVPVTSAPGTSGPPLNAATISNIGTELATDATNLQAVLE